MPRKKATPAAAKPADPLKNVEIIMPGQNGGTQPGTTPPVVAAVANPGGLFTARELGRLGTLSQEIESLRQRSADLLERANMAALQVFNVATGEQPDGSRAADILAGIDKAGPTLAAGVVSYATKQRARAKLTAAQREFEVLRGFAGEDEPTGTTALEQNPGGLPLTGENPHGLETMQPGESTESKLPIADALPPAGEDDCPE